MKKIIPILLLVVSTIAIAATTFTINYNLAKPGDRDTNYGQLIRDNFDTIDTQMKTNADSVTTHISDPTGAHNATAITTTPGTNICITQTTVQAYLDCLDGVFDPSTSGVVLIQGSQTIVGQKSFTANPIFSAATSGIIVTNVSGLVSSSTFSAQSPQTTKGDLIVYDTASNRLAVGTDGAILIADSTEASGVKWTAPIWRKFTRTFTNFSTAGTTFGVTIFNLNAEEGIETVVVKHSTAFTGGAITKYVVSVGLTGNSDKFSNPFDVFIAPVDTVSSVNNVVEVPDFGSTTNIVVTATSTGANLDQASAGSVDIYVKTFQLP